MAHFASGVITLRVPANGFALQLRCFYLEKGSCILYIMPSMPAVNGGGVPGAGSDRPNERTKSDHFVKWGGTVLTIRDPHNYRQILVVNE